jgi:hypothetical protein
MMIKMATEIELPANIIELFEEVFVYERCRNAMAKEEGYEERAIAFGKLAYKLDEAAWKEVNNMFPETLNGYWKYCGGKVTLIQN